MWREALAAINRTNFEHAFYGVAMQLGTLALFWWMDFYAGLAAGSLLGIGFFAGREHAQAEKRLLKQGIKNTVGWVLTFASGIGTAAEISSFRRWPARWWRPWPSCSSNLYRAAPDGSLTIA